MLSRLRMGRASVAPSSGIQPGVLWNGTAGTGFAVTPTVDPYTVAKTEAITLRLLTPDRLHFGTATKIWVRAECFGGLGALASVEMLFEGNTYTGDGPKVCTETNPRTGSGTISFIGYEWTVNRNDWATYGDIAVYFKATPVDTNIPARTFGPFYYYKHNYAIAGGLYDADIVFGTGLSTVAGVSYPTLEAALNYCSTNLKNNPRLTCTVTGDYIDGNAATYMGKGRARIEAAPGVTCTFKAEDLYGTFRVKYSALHYYGSGIRFNMGVTVSVVLETTDIAPVFEGVTFYNSGGFGGLFNGTLWGQNCCGGWRIGCDFTNLAQQTAGLLTRNCAFDGHAGDIATGMACFVSNTGVNCSNYQYRQPQNSMTISCSLGGTPTYAKLNAAGVNDGTLDETTHIWRLTDLNGTQDFSLSTYYTIAALATAISARTGWTAAPASPGSGRRAAALSQFGSTFAPVTASASPATIISSFDIHGDFHQAQEGGAINQNIIIADNKFTMIEGNTIVRENGILYGLYFGGNAFSIDNTYDPYTGQFGNYTQKGIQFVHNTILGQGLVLASGKASDTYSEYANNVIGGEAEGLATASGFDNSSGNSQAIAYNHSVGGAITGSTNTSTGGTKANLVTNATSGDFTPAGALLSNLAPRKAKFDRNLSERASSDAKGAVKAA